MTSFSGGRSYPGFPGQSLATPAPSPLARWEEDSSSKLPEVGQSGHPSTNIEWGLRHAMQPRRSQAFWIDFRPAN